MLGSSRIINYSSVNQSNKNFKRLINKSVFPLPCTEWDNARVNATKCCQRNNPKKRFITTNLLSTSNLLKQRILLPPLRKRSAPLISKTCRIIIQTQVKHHLRLLVLCCFLWRKITMDQQQTAKRKLEVKLRITISSQVLRYLRWRNLERS